MLDDFRQFLADDGVTLTELSQKESFAITKQWTSSFAAQSKNLSEIHGRNAVEHWLKTTDENLILLFLSARISAFPISENSRPCTANRYEGRPIDLSAYNELEFAVFPESYEWTLIHTHEDGAFGGPYFLQSLNSSL